MCGEVWIYEQTTKTMRSKEIGLCALDLVNVEARYSTHLEGEREGRGDALWSLVKKQSLHIDNGLAIPLNYKNYDFSWELMGRIDVGLNSTLVVVSSLVVCFISYNNWAQMVKVSVEGPHTLDQSKMNQHDHYSQSLQDQGFFFFFSRIEYMILTTCQHSPRCLLG